MRRRAFTLIEIILVVAIMIVLVGIVFSAFGPVRESARERSCVSNLRQIGMAIGLYVADYDGIDPIKGERMMHSDLGLPTGHSRSVSALFNEYIKNKSIKYCPSYHGREPASQLGSTYHWPVFLSEDTATEFDLPGLVAKRGSDYVVVTCEQHNSNLDFMDQARWSTKRVTVLRLSQQVQVKFVSARFTTDLDW
jgi:type II secretory pathway pseudopilin PulG